MSGPFHPDPQVRPTGAPPLLRTRGDRRGLEPLDPGFLPRPDKPPPGGWKIGDWSGPVWTGGPVDRLLVDITHGGLGDAVRMLSIVAGLRRQARPIGTIVVVHRGTGPAGWVQRAVAPTQVHMLTDGPPQGDAALPPIHALPPLAWNDWPSVPLTALVAHLLSIPLPVLAGPCVLVNRPAVQHVLGLLEQAGWDRRKAVVAVQTNGHAVGPELTQQVHHEKVPRSLLDAVPHLIEAGVQPLIVGGHSTADLGLEGVVDLGGSPLDLLVAALYVADLAVTGDSGPLHVAAALGTPTLALFGPSDPRLHVSAAGVVVLQPELRMCPRIPCGVSSLLGGPTEEDRATRVPLPCPPEGGCLTRTSGAWIADRALRTLAQIVANA